MPQSRQRSSGSAERPSLDNFPTDLSGAGKQDLPSQRTPVQMGLHLGHFVPYQNCVCCAVDARGEAVGAPQRSMP